MSRRWEITLWAEAEHVSDHEYEGDYAGALERAEDIVESYRGEGWTRPLEAQVRPAGVLFESVPTGWRIDEERGELRRREGAPADPLPHVAVRAMEGGNVLTICERGLQRSRPAMQVIARVVPRHLGSERKVSLESVVACQRELEDDLARLAARRVIVAIEDTDAGRVWS